MALDKIRYADTPSNADPIHSWPRYAIVGGYIRIGGQGTAGVLSDIAKARELHREDEEIIIILSAILKEL